MGKVIDAKGEINIEHDRQAQCHHCGEEVIHAIFNETDERKEHPFCCHGCQTVWNILHDKGLGQYYILKGENKSTPVAAVVDSYAYLDQEEFQKDYLQKRDDGTARVDFYLEGVHCLACLWLVEKMPDFIPGVQTARLNLESSCATFIVDTRFSLSQLAAEIARLGYRPMPIKRDDDVEKFRKKEERSSLIRIGVAMACMGNIFIFAVSNYGGAEGVYESTFNWLSFFLSLPVVLYSATPFYHNAWSALKRKVVSIDLPVAIAIWVGTLGGVFNLLRGVGEVYFDSLTSLVFLLLLGRYIMIKARQKGVNSSNLEYFNSFGACLRQVPGSDDFEEIHTKYLKVNDIIKVTTGQIIPVDGKVEQGDGLINTSLITGESLPVSVARADQVFSGTVNVDGTLLIRVEKTGQETQIGKMLDKVEEGRNSKTPLVNMADNWSKKFISIILSIAFILIIAFTIMGNSQEGLLRAMSLIIVTCPCALALATPLALTRTMGTLSSMGIIVRSEDVVESLAHAQNIFLDKTGTLTKGCFQVVASQLNGRDEKQINEIIYALEKKSSHPIAITIKEYCQSLDVAQVECNNWKEVSGVGVEGEIDGKYYQIRRKIGSNAAETVIVLKENGNNIAELYLKDSLREDSRIGVERLQQMDIKPQILSGDNRATVEAIAQELKIDKTHVLAELSPEEKLNHVKNEKNSIMVGDGANDAMALDAASVGIAVKGSMDISLKAADIYLVSPGIAKVTDLVDISKETLRVIKRNLWFSIFYNLIGGGLSILGIIGPLWAAVLMPLSSLTVLFSTILGTQKMRALSRREL